MAYDQQQQPIAASSPLDQLEAQVNLVLEHTGRIFAGSARNQKGNGSINNPARLRQVYAGAIVNFHDALDVLEEELAIARAVMRRDLAVYRTALESQNSDARSKEQAANGKIQEDTKSGNASSETAQDTDVTMTGDSPQTLKDLTPHDASKAGPAALLDEDLFSSETSESAKPAVEQTEASKSTEEPLHLEMPSGEHSGGDAPTDAATGTYSNFDFESLFNDPSAQASPIPAPAAEAAQEVTKPSPSRTQASPPVDNPGQTITVEPEIGDPEPTPQLNDSSNDNFDFGDLTNFGESSEMPDNDNISSLLPGLESYANAPDAPQQPTNNASDTFNIFDAAGAPDFGGGDGGTIPSITENGGAAADVSQAGEQPIAMESVAEDGDRDNTFDDLMNFDNFDIGSFGGDDEDGKTAFDASFFDIS